MASMADLELRHLRLICAIADEPSLTRAAARLGVSQPSLSASLQRIERRVGGQIFERSHTGMRVTDFGAYLVGAARIVLADMDNLLAGAASRVRQTSGELRIGTSPGGIGPMLARAIGQALSLAEITVETAVLGRLSQEVDAQRLDFAVLEECAGLPLPVPDRVEMRQIIAEPVFVALPEAHRLRDHATIRLADLAEEDWVVEPMRDNNDQVVLARACAEAGFRPRVRHEVNEARTQRELIANGAVALAQPTSRNGDGIVVRPLEGNPIMLEHWLAWHPSGPHARHAPAVYRCAAEIYLGEIDRNPAYRRWWDEHPDAHRQFDAVVNPADSGMTMPSGSPGTVSW
jgi:DNA-binding transcriptional LysR family regulator